MGCLSLNASSRLFQIPTPSITILNLQQILQSLYRYSNGPALIENIVVQTRAITDMKLPSDKYLLYYSAVGASFPLRALKKPADCN